MNFKSLVGCFGVVCLVGFASATIGQHGQDFADETFLRKIGNNALWIGYVAETAAGRGSAYKQGSAYLIDAHRAVTAAHVVADLVDGQQFVVQVGALRTHQPYLTTGKVLAIDKQRDLALLEIETTNQWAGFINDTVACNMEHPIDGKVYVAGLAPQTTGASGSSQRFLSPFFKHVLHRFDKYPDKVEMSDGIRPHFNVGDSIVTLAETLNPGDSGGAILDSSGCLLGVVSMATQFVDDGVQRTVTIGPRFQPGDAFLMLDANKYRGPK